MEKIIFDEKTFIYKTKLDLSAFKTDLITECEKIINLDPNNNRGSYDIPNSDNFKIRNNTNTNFDNYEIRYDKNDGKIIEPPNNYISNVLKVIQHGIDNCIKLHDEPYGKVLHTCWVNVFRPTNFLQKKGHGGVLDRYHVHTKISKAQNSFAPKYTYVYYIQMPDNLIGNDGVLNIMGAQEKEYHFLPKEDELIILDGDLPHGPQPARDSSLDRIVIAGNIGFIKPFKYSFDE